MVEIVPDTIFILDLKDLDPSLVEHVYILRDH